MSNKKLLFITQYFYPEVFKGNDIAFELVKKGIDVTVITGIPNYPKGTFFPGYGLFKKRKEIINGVKVIRLPLVPRGTSTISLISNYFSFAVVASIFTLAHVLFHKYNCCFIQQLSPITIALPGVVFKKITKKPLYSWVLDLWPESLQSAGGIKNKLILNFFASIAKLMYKNSDKILISSKGFKESIVQKGDYLNKIIYFPNWAEDVFLNCSKKTIPVLPNGFRIMFAGNIGEAQDFEHIIEAAKFLKEEENIKLILIGDGRKKRWVEEQIKINNLEKIVYLLGRFPLETMPSFFNEADVMLVSLKDELIFSLTAPAKIQAYMSASKPIIAMMNGEGNDLIKEADCGIAVDAESSDKLVYAFRSIKLLSKEERNKLGENGKLYCENYFNKNKSINFLYDLISN